MPLPSIAGDIPLDQAGLLGGPTPAAAAPTGFFERVKLGWKQSGAAENWGSNEVNWRNSAISEINDGLRKKGIEPAVDLMDYDNMERKLPQQRGESYDQYQNRAFRTVLAQVAQARAADPGLLPDYAPVVDKGSFDQLIAKRRNAVLQDVSTRAPDGLGIGGLTGDIGHGFVDPISYIPVGGPEMEGASIGARILKQALTGAAINAGVTTVTEPLVRIDAARLGHQRTAGDFVTDLLTSAATGGFLMAGVEGARVGKDAVVEALQRRRAEPATGTPFDSFDAKVAKTFAEIVPEDQRTPDEQAAIHAVMRDAEVKAGSPFVAGPAGDDAHAQSLDRGMKAIHNPDQLPQRGPVKPIDRATVGGPDDVEGTRTPGRELLKAKIHSVEAPHGGPNLAGGNALGPYQFEPRTWVSLFKRRYSKDARSFAEIAALREDPHLNDVLMNDLISENAAALRHAGFDESAGNLYLAHVLGHDRAVTLLRADPNARLGDLLPEGYFKHNPFKADQSAASLVHWAYGKMGDKGLPIHIAEAPDAAQGAEAIAAGEADPQVQPSTGRFDVEALYGDVGMTDRPVLNPDHFASAEDHAVAQVRFERASDAADGFAPVMSRAEAFAPGDHFDAVRGYRGTVTTDAMGEALGLSPGEVRRVVGSMQATDPNSPFVLTRGRPPRFDGQGNVTREGTEAGRVIRRPPRPVKSTETLLEFLSARGGLKDEGGDLAAMDAQLWHKGAPFRRKLIDNENGMSQDDAFTAAIEAGFFPEHSGHMLGGTDLPDLAGFHEAIDEELRGNPRHSIADSNAVMNAREAARAREAEDHPPVEDAATRAERLLERTGHNHEAIAEAANRRGITLTDDDMVIDASDLIDAGMDPDEALDHAAIASAYRSLDEAAAETGNSSYAIDPDERFAGDDGLPEQTGSGDGGDLPPDHGGGRSEGVAGAAAEARSGLEEPAHDPAAGRFSDPIGDTAEAQADSNIHDLEMEPPAEGEAVTYRLDEEGGESDLASILDEIEQAQKAATEMRNCLKPKGGDE